MEFNYKPTREKLYQAYYINQEIKNLQWMLERSGTDIQSQQITGMPHANTNVPSDPTADAGIKIADIRMQIEYLRERCREEKAKIWAYIIHMEDSRMRQIVMLRCIELLSWEDVADRIGGGNSAATCKMAFYREFE